MKVTSKVNRIIIPGPVIQVNFPFSTLIKNKIQSVYVVELTASKLMSLYNTSLRWIVDHGSVHALFEGIQIFHSLS